MEHVHICMWQQCDYRGVIRCLMFQVLLERCIHACSTTDLGLSYPELNKAVEDPLSTQHSDGSEETVLDVPLTMESAMHLHVPLSLLDHELDLSRHVLHNPFPV